jgi:putative oxidoreductase
MSDKFQRAAFLFGRIILGGYFLYSGIHHFQDRKTMAQYAGAKKVPLPDVAVPASGAMLIAGGASLLLGIRPRLGALAILTFLAGVSPIMHDFWKHEDPQQRMNEMINFTKNLALAGAALALAGVEEWPLSVAAEESDTKRLVRKVRRLAA